MPSPEQIQRALINQLNRELRLLDCFKGQEKELYHALCKLIEENESINKGITSITSAIEAQELGKAQETDLLKRIAQLPAYDAIKTALHDNLKNVEWLSKENFATKYELSLETETLSSSTTEYLIEKYSPVDMRHQIDERNIRRWDSLSRLFSFSPSISVCSAVAIHDGKLLIAANLSAESERASLIAHVKARCLLLNQFILDKDAATEESISILCAALKAHGGSTISPPILQQAIRKFHHAIWEDQETFPETTKTVFQSPHLRFELLLPVLDGENTAAIQIINCHTQETDCHADEPQQIPLNCGQNWDTLVHTDRVSLIHAEQLIAWRVFSAKNTQILNAGYSDENPLEIGITKLCCKTCEHNLKAFPIKVRGGHEQSYQGVVSFFSPANLSIVQTIPGIAITNADRSSPNSDEPPPNTTVGSTASTGTPRRASTAARNSPPNSTEKPQEKKQIDLESLKAVQRQLFFIGEEKEEKEDVTLSAKPTRTLVLPVFS